MRAGALGVLVMAGLLAIAPVTSVTAAPGQAKGNGVAEHWTTARMKAATPRDLVIDDRGLAYIEQKDGSLEPQGHATPQLHTDGAKPAAAKPTAGKPGGSDTTGPTIGARTPADGATAGASQTFTANVTDPSGVRSVTFTIVYPNGSTQSFTTSRSGSTYSRTISGFTTGAWKWRVVATDSSSRRNVTTSTDWSFNVDTGGGGGQTNVANSRYTGGGAVQNAAGRIFFEMPNSAGSWVGYVCSGTVATDATSGRSIIITAAHCVYDDARKVFARNVMFIPNQDATTGAGTDRNCANDPIGCWTPSFGVVDTDWTTRTFPANIPWDYGFYVVSDTGAHTAGINSAGDALDGAAGSLPVQTTSDPANGAFTHALGYSYSDDPNFMYCAQGIATESSYNDWWLSQCGLSGGASGGPWITPLSGGTGPIVSVNSWGYTNQPGMGGAKLFGNGSSAGCVFAQAKSQANSGANVTNRGVAVC